MASSKRKTPGVYINEVSGFPNSVVPVATAVPAFIGYTPQAEYEGKSYEGVPQKITSFADFFAIYLKANPAPPADPAVQYAPQYYLVESATKPEQGEYVLLGTTYYSVVPDPRTIYYLYNSIRLFYENGGGDAYIVSVGTYGPSGGTPAKPGEQIVNPNVLLDDLLAGLALLKNEEGPTMYICPEATLLSLDDNATLMQAMLAQAQDMQTAVCIFDIIGGNDPDPLLWTHDIESFRTNTGTRGLKYGVCYYPFVNTTISQNSDITYTNLFGGVVKQLEPLLNPSSDPNEAAAKILNEIQHPPANPLPVSQYNSALLAASPTYATIMKHVLNQVNTLPPSGGMAGLYTVIDNTQGVWYAPANVSIIGVVGLPLYITEAQQADLNVDAATGKSVNALRSFSGLGILVWGARTLDGNSNDWRYINVRRTMIMIEQSCKLALRAYVFEPNDAQTWATVKSTLENFLTTLWKEGALVGTSAAEAFSVAVGLGTTMAQQDLLNGFMRVSIQVALTHPAEFIVITIEQQMAAS